jgi:hypothetical protein
MRSFIPTVLVVLATACSTTAPAPMLFSGTYYPNISESTLLPGQRIPKDMVMVMHDDGSSLQLTQTFTTGAGQQMKYVWKGKCDGSPRAAEGIGPPAVVTASCRHTEQGPLVISLADNHGYSHVETCGMSVDGRKQTCAGTASLPDGTKHDFVYVFDRR